MFALFMKKLGYIKEEPGSITLSIDEVDVLVEAIQDYQERLPNKRYGYFSEVSSSIKTKVEKIRPGAFARFLHL